MCTCVIQRVQKPQQWVAPTRLKAGQALLSTMASRSVQFAVTAPANTPKPPPSAVLLIKRCTQSSGPWLATIAEAEPRAWERHQPLRLASVSVCTQNVIWHASCTFKAHSSAASRRVPACIVGGAQKAAASATHL